MSVTSSGGARRIACYLDPDAVGGMEQSLSTLLAGLDERYEVEMLSTDVEIASTIAAARPGTLVTAVPRVMGKSDVTAMWELRRAFHRAAPDLTLVSHGQLYAGQYGILAAALTRRPIMSVVHCVLPRTDVLQARLMRGAARFVSKFVAVSDAVALATASELHLPLSRLTVVHNGVPEASSPPPPIRRASNDRRVLGCVGRLSKEKGYDVALRALAQLPDCELVFLGDGKELGKLRRMAASLGVHERVHFEGWVAPPWTERWRFDALLVPSRYEGFGLVAVEAMVAGIPVVASDVAGLSEVVRDGQTGILVRPDEPEELISATRRLLDDAALRNDLVAHAHADACTRFSPDTMVHQYENLFDEVLGVSGARSVHAS